MQEQIIKTKLEKLPEDLKKEALDYIEFLIQKYRSQIKKEKFQFDWEGAYQS